MKQNCSRDLCELHSRRIRTTSLVGVSLSALLCSSLHAADSASDQDVKLQEVVVTAQRRVENLQLVPISAQVISGEALAAQNQNSLQRLTEITPAVHVNPAGPSTDMYIRGIGSGGNESLDQSVGTFIDDIYHGRSRLVAATFLDLDRIEVLKGPQSTFFGNNAIAGALNIVTKKPGDTFDASVRALYGTYGQYAAEGAVTVPFSDKLSIRAAGIANGGTGWIENVNTGNKAPVDHNVAGRVTLLYKPNDELDATLKIEGSDNRESGVGFGGQPLQTFNCPPPPPLTPESFGPLASCPTVLAQNLPNGLNNNENTGQGGQGNVLDTNESVLTINYRQWGQTFTSVTGYYGYRFNFKWDNTNLPTLAATVTGPEHFNQFSQEFRIASPTDQPIEYLAGAYFQIDHLRYGLEINLPFLNFISSIPPFASLASYLPIAENQLFSQDEKVYAVFGSVGWNATDRLKLSAGLRAVSNHKENTNNSYFGTGTQLYGGFVQDPPEVTTLMGAIFGHSTPATVGSFNRTDRALLPSAKIQYQIQPQVMSYLSYARGFLAGGFNGTDSSFDVNSLPFEPEYVNAYEVGLKSKWLDDTVLFNVDLFRSDYSNLQVSSLVAGSVNVNGAPTGGYQAIRNAAASRSQGVEFEGQWAVGRHFRLAANVTYLDAYYARYPDGPPTLLDQGMPPGLGITAENLTGRPTLFAPRWSGSLTVAYSMSLPGNYQFTAELMPYFSTGYFLQGDASDDPLLYQSGYSRLDGRLAIQNADGHWSVDLIGKNLTNRVILKSFGGPFLASKEEPANFAVQFRYHW